jgi:hypothetical protein
MNWSNTMPKGNGHKRLPPDGSAFPIVKAEVGPDGPLWLSVDGSSLAPPPFHVELVPPGHSQPIDLRKLAATLLNLNETHQQESVIFSLGNRQYRTMSTNPIFVTENENNVLQAFVGCGFLDEHLLRERSGVPHAPKILSRLRHKYGGILASAIHCPGRKAQGGYHVQVIPATST